MKTKTPAAYIEYRTSMVSTIDISIDPSEAEFSGKKLFGIRLSFWGPVPALREFVPSVLIA